MKLPSSLLFVTTVCIWGSTFWAITLQLGDVAPSISVAYRFALSSLCIFLWCGVRKESIKLSKETHLWLALQGFCNFSLSYICTYVSEQYVVSAFVSILFAMMVIWTPLVERVFLKKPLNWRIGLAALISIVGVILLFYPHIQAELSHFNQASSTSLAQSSFIFGIVIAVIGTLASTFGNLFLLKVRQHSSALFPTMAWAMAWGTLWISLYALVMGDTWRIPQSWSYWLSLLHLSLLGSVVAFACYFTLIHRIGAPKTTFIAVIVPIISVLLSMLFENYRPHFIEYVGMVVCLSGVVLAMIKKKS